VTPDSGGQANLTKDVRPGARLERLAREFRHAARRLLRSPAFTLATVLTLTLAIGATVSIFAVVYRVLLKPLPYPDSERLIALDYGAPSLNVASGITMTSEQYDDLVDRARSLDGVAIYGTGELTLTGDGEPERIRVSPTTPSLTSVLGVQPERGRWFTEAETVARAAPVAVLSHGLWVRRYGQSSAVIGRSVALNGVATTVIGVMPPSFTFPDSRIDVWTPAPISRAASTLFIFSGVARLRQGVTVADARAELTRLSTDLSRESVRQGVFYARLRSTATTLIEATVGRIAATLWILLASVGLVLLVACANVANLFLVRSDARQREIAVRRALGAGSGGIARYFMAESAALSTAGGALGLALAWGAVRLLVASGPASLPRLAEVRLDGVAIVFTVALILLTALIFGAMPLLRLAPLGVSLHENGRCNTASRGRHRLRRLLMAGQVALALVLLVSSGLMVRSFQKLRAVDPGFDATSALTFRIGLPDRAYPTRAAAVAAHHAMLNRLSTLPGMTAVSAASCLPLVGSCWGNGLRVQGRAVPVGTIMPFVTFHAVAGGYVETMGMRLLRGRGIDRGDVDRSEPVVVINEALAKQYFPNQDPIGEHVASWRPGNLTWLRIVGIVSNTATKALAEATAVPKLFMPMSIAGGPEIPPLIGPDVTAMSYVLHTASPPHGMVTAVRTAIGEIDASLAIADVRTLGDLFDRASAQMAFTMVLIGIAAAVALLLGVIGIYGVMSYIVTQRTGEIGVRLALGAERRRVASMIVRQGGLVALAGITVGLATAYTGSRLIESLLYGVSPRDPGVFAATTLTLLAVALLACWLPARRAARLSPLDALRTD
jgi:putative ABC transport system permease protein